MKRYLAAVKLFQEEWTNEDVAEALGIKIRQVQEYRKRFTEDASNLVNDLKRYRAAKESLAAAS